MAADWIKVRPLLLTHPKTLRMASALNADRFRIVGGLVAVWGVADSHTVSGFLSAYKADTLDGIIGWPGFTEAMAAVGWLSIDEEGIEFTEFPKHNGTSAKRRAQDSDRKADARKSASDADKKRDQSESESREALGNDNKGAKASKGGESAKPQRPPEQTPGVTTYPNGFDGPAPAPDAATAARHELAVRCAAETNRRVRGDRPLSSKNDPLHQSLILGAAVEDYIRAADMAVEQGKGVMWVPATVLGWMQDRERRRGEPPRIIGAAADLSGKDYEKGATPDDKIPAHLRPANPPEDAQ